MSPSDLDWQQWMIRAVAIGVVSGFFAFSAPYVKEWRLRRFCWWVAIGAGLTSFLSLVFGVVQLVKQ
jgi:hypothetical protein